MTPIADRERYDVIGAKWQAVDVVLGLSMHELRPVDARTG
jgi:hypothetical protein